ncbi:MAG: ABC transporter ATP-binding protein [Clostridia bacterium]|nr:ABC transporter ATP-binding protein [Clostridia bacterium]
MLEFINVTKKYLRRTALDGVSFSLDAGKVCLLLGPNGSGKTTAMKLAAGLSRETSGEVLFDGHRVGAREKARLAYMPTENYFYNYMTVRDAGRYYADFFNDFDPNAFEAWLRRMELDDRDRINKLSSGMSAKLRLALILSRDARLMMFDEPLNGVDILTRQQVIEAILTARDPSRTLLISTHLVDELEAMVDTCVFLKEGRLIAAGSKRDTCGDVSLKDRYIEIYGHGQEGGEADA